ncbi:MAG TPA: glycoside hydrolase family 97 N-terminal domain-containing protein, partial [Segetibacter sp.]
MNSKIFIVVLFFSFYTVSFGQNGKGYQLKSPDGKLSITINTGARLTWAVAHENTTVITPSVIALTVDNGEVLGNNMQ